jgi:hypothetical protein
MSRIMTDVLLYRLYKPLDLREQNDFKGTHWSKEN